MVVIGVALLRSSASSDQYILECDQASSDGLNFYFLYTHIHTTSIVHTWREQLFAS